MEKLIRDRIHLIPHPLYGSLQIRRVKDTAEHFYLLTMKILEERQEFDEAHGEDRLEEAADLLEVLDTLIQIAEVGNLNHREVYIHEREELIVSFQNIGLSVDQIHLIQKEKKMEKGGFLGGIVGIFPDE